MSYPELITIHLDVDFATDLEPQVADEVLIIQGSSSPILLPSLSAFSHNLRTESLVNR